MDKSYTPPYTQNCFVLPIRPIVPEQRKKKKLKKNNKIIKQKRAYKNLTQINNPNQEIDSKSQNIKGKSFQLKKKKKKRKLNGY